ncbi:MAG: hypothetical protein Q4A06_06730 [Cardiobacteriaceae bacterium]|nr:hypothetical protein [Cardiobacteriaceae bacterium]
MSQNVTQVSLEMRSPFLNAIKLWKIKRQRHKSINPLMGKPLQNFIRWKHALSGTITLFSRSVGSDSCQNHASKNALVIVFVYIIAAMSSTLAYTAVSNNIFCHYTLAPVAATIRTMQIDFSPFRPGTLFYDRQVLPSLIHNIWPLPNLAHRK